ncbi:YitT family protein [Defluviitalea phaphyphila]|uniref:YitT family protein n=1 Tax=Defluviitalea phaphyphila TaxID=1473580 RepID=UPI0007306468|nr:YitT family protein [Defluviitalea phaphyphila]
MGKLIRRELFREYLLIILGTTILACAINLFFEKQGLVTGGITGLAIVVKHITQPYFKGGIPLWFTNIILNIPLFLIGIMIRGKGFGVKSLFSTFYLSFALYYTKFLPTPPADMLLSSLFGGVLSGVGLGFVFISKSTTGGTDLAASIIQHYIKHFPVGQIMVVLDAVIIFSGALIFGPVKAMYAIIAVYITGKILDNMLEGIHFSKAVYIISDKGDIIADEIMRKMDRGVTGLNGRGMYTKDKKEILFCVVSKKEIFQLKEIVRNKDHEAFVIVSDVREVLGEGFIEYKSE